MYIKDQPTFVLLSVVNIATWKLMVECSKLPIYYLIQCFSEWVII